MTEAQKCGLVAVIGAGGVAIIFWLVWTILTLLEALLQLAFYGFVIVGGLYVGYALVRAALQFQESGQPQETARSRSQTNQSLSTYTAENCPWCRHSDGYFTFSDRCIDCRGKGCAYCNHAGWEPVEVVCTHRAYAGQNEPTSVTDERRHREKISRG